MAKKDKVPLTPEQIAEKKLNGRKNRARVLAIVLAIAITAVVYVVGSKDGHKVQRIEPQAVAVDRVVEKVVEKEVTVTVTVAAPTETTTAASAETTTAAAPTTEEPTTAAPAPSGSESGGGILDTITGLLGGLVDGLGDIDIGGLVGGIGDSVDVSGAADTVEGIGNSAQDFFYGIADKVGGSTAE